MANVKLPLVDDDSSADEAGTGREDMAGWPRSESVEALFQKLAAEWQDATARFSSSSKIVQHPAYQQIIQLGQAAVPMILRDLDREPDHWFAALRAITGEDPVAPTDHGYMDRMAAAWVRWGKDHGLRW